MDIVLKVAQWNLVTRQEDHMHNIFIFFHEEILQQWVLTVQS